MDSSSDNFDSLRKLLKLKRHEQPPPRYFNDFSSRVLSRIERGEGRISWWEKFGFDLRPALAAATGVLACGLIVYGVATADGGEAGAGAAYAGNGFNGMMASADMTAANSTNPVASYGTPIDRKVFGGQVAPAAFQMR